MKRRSWMNEGDPESLIELTDILDEGASGAVFEGLLSNEKVAIKVIPGLDDPAVNAEVHAEILILRKIASEVHFVGFRGAWEKEDHAWIAMELCEGGSVIDLCQVCQTNLTPAECAALTASVLMGLKFLHDSLGVIHRDIKGKNILLKRDGWVKLTDLGIAIEAPKVPTSVMPAGSPHWMAPELAGTTPYTYTGNDIWSLGITLIELVEGEPPHSETSPTEVLRLVESSPPPSFQRKDLGTNLPSFLAECLVRDETKRPSAAHLLKHPFVDSCVMHLMVSEKPEPVIKALVDRAYPILTEYREYEKERFRNEQNQQQEPEAKASQDHPPPPAPPPPQPVAIPAKEPSNPSKPRWSEADGDLFIVDSGDHDDRTHQTEAKASKTSTVRSSVQPSTKSTPRWSEADGDLFIVEEKITKPKWSEAEGDLFIVEDETEPKQAKPITTAKWSEAEGDLFYVDEGRDRRSIRLDFIEGRDNSSSYEQQVGELNTNRPRRTPESIRATEKVVKARQSARRQSEVARDSQQVKSMMARLSQLQTKFDKDVSRMKKMLPKGAFT